MSDTTPTTQSQPVRITEAAAAKARALLDGSKRPDDALRILVKDGGCSGMRYELLFDGQGEGDTRIEENGLAVVIDAESLPYLEGITLDFSDDINDAGFKIENPKAETTCGCGESFSLL